MPYSTNYYEDIFNLSYEDTREEQIEALRNPDIKRYRLKTIFSGEILESESYPIWATGKKAVVEEFKRSRPEQQNLNNKNVRKKIVRLLNGNFTEDDIWITVGYRDGVLPPTEEQARKDVVNYIRRLQRYCQKNGLPKLKYVYVTEFSEDTRVHHHIVMSFPDRDVAEKLWKKGKYPQARRLMPNDYGLEGLARYISKDPKGSKSYGYSLNLFKSWEKPHARTADSKITRKKAERLASGEIEPKAFYEKLYKGYEFLDLEVRYSEFVSGCYLYARMRRKPEPKKKRKKEVKPNDCSLQGNKQRNRRNNRLQN
jgi:hypothetical protein